MRTPTDMSRCEQLEVRIHSDRQRFGFHGLRPRLRLLAAGALLADEEDDAEDDRRDDNEAGDDDAGDGASREFFIITSAVVGLLIFTLPVTVFLHSSWTVVNVVRLTFRFV